VPKFVVLVCLCIYLPDDDVVEVETVRSTEWHYYLLFIVQFDQILYRYSNCYNGSGLDMHGHVQTEVYRILN
jgi:hypothetical protein